MTYPRSTYAPASKRVYFMKPVGLDGPIKIGCTGFPEERLRQMMIWSPIQLEMLYVEEAPHSVERSLHRCFADYHSHLEWFHAGERLVAAISRMMAGEKIADVVDLDAPVGSIFDGRKKRISQKPISSKPLEVRGEAL